ncbi:hypothetical protein ACHQM5_025820 [Ranunculus cassubicifolius]
MALEERIEEVKEEYKTAKTSVWWYLDKCKVPEDSTFHPETIAANITSSLFNIDLRGPVSIFAYGDVHRIPNSIHQTLINTGITLNQAADSSLGGTYDDACFHFCILFLKIRSPPPLKKQIFLLSEP